MNIHFKIAFWASIISFVLSILNNPLLTSVKRMVIVFLIFYALAYFMIAMIKRDVRQIERKKALEKKKNTADTEDNTEEKIEKNSQEDSSDNRTDQEGAGFQGLDPEKIVTQGIDIEGIDFEKAADAVRALQND